MESVLSASPPPDDFFQAQRARDGKIFVALLIAVMVFTWLLGVLVLQGTLASRSVFGWMAMICLMTAGWYGYGFGRETSDKDPGLILSCAGWFLAALAAFVRFLSDGPVASPAVSVFGWLAALLVVTGAVWSLVRWFQSANTPQNDDDFDLSSALRSAGQK